MAIKDYNIRAAHNILECGLYRSVCGSADPSTHYAEALMRAAQIEWPRGLGLSEFLSIVAGANTHEHVSHRNVRGMIDGAFRGSPRWATAGSPSTYNVAGILSNIANKMITDAFQAVDQSWRLIAAKQQATDLKEMKIFSLTSDLEYLPVSRTGELKHGTLEEIERSIKASTFGRIFSVSEDDILNDDLSCFSRIQQMLGRGAALALNRVAWSTLLATQATFWTVARSNRMVGAASALGIDSLSRAATMLETMTDPQGAPLGTVGAILCVPSELKTEANQYVSDSEIRKIGITAAETYTVKNPHAGRFRVAASPYLNNATVPNGSPLHWLLMADPKDMPTLLVSFLFGEELPRIESASAPMDVLAIQMRGVHRFGAALGEWRGSVYSQGI